MVRIKAFTLFESVVAISIMSILIGLGTMIYGNLVEAEKPISYYQAKEQIDQLYADLQVNKSFFSKNFEYETYNIEQKVEFHLGNKKVYEIEYIVSTQGKQWWKEKHLIANNLSEE